MSLALIVTLYKNGIKFQYPNGGTLPNFPRFRVDEEAKCDPTITSVFGDAVHYRRDLESLSQSITTCNYTIKLPQEVSKGIMIVTTINGQDNITTRNTKSFLFRGDRHYNIQKEIQY
ncbi:MAG: hypothetical protein IPN29_00015 [Saprospiraceae bacterium]|nr:hypothetical protein [Saprospiraceae bacterium]